MAYVKYQGNFKSSDQQHKIQYYIYEPECEIQGIIQICHGMQEHLTMYEEAIAYFCDCGYLVCGHDYLGHGNSVGSQEEYGYFGAQNGWSYLIKDAKKLNQYVKKEYKDVPCFLIGHSMGSFLVRLYTIIYPDSVDGIVCLGTSGKHILNVVGLGLLRLKIKKKGDHYRSKRINEIAMKLYNKKFAKEKNEFSWLTKEEYLRKQYQSDEKKSFLYTLAGLRDLLTMLYFISQKSWYERMPKQLPVLLLSGKDDPVGNYGKGVTEVYDKLKAAGCVDVTKKIYENDRHVLLHETNREEIVTEVMNWIGSKNIQSK